MSSPTSPTVRQITADWATEFPDIPVWKSMRLVRRVDALMVGICLDRRRDRYQPIVHVTSLMRDRAGDYLTMPQPLRALTGSPASVRFQLHRMEFPRAAARLREQNHTLLGALPGTADIVRDIRTYCVREHEESNSPRPVELEDSILAAAAIGDHDLVDSGLVFAEDLSSRWDKARLPADWSGRTYWLAGLAGKAKRAADLMEAADGQARSLGLPE